MIKYSSFKPSDIQDEGNDDNVPFAIIPVHESK